MTKIGTVFKDNTTKAMLLGSGELGREVVIELKRLGVEVVAVDRYADAPAMQVADRSYVISMLDPRKLEEIIRKENNAPGSHNRDNGNCYRFQDILARQDETSFPEIHTTFFSIAIVAIFS